MLQFVKHLQKVTLALKSNLGFGSIDDDKENDDTDSNWSSAGKNRH